MSDRLTQRLIANILGDCDDNAGDIFGIEVGAVGLALDGVMNLLPD